MPWIILYFLTNSYNILVSIINNDTAQRDLLIEKIQAKTPVEIDLRHLDVNIATPKVQNVHGDNQTEHNLRGVLGTIEHSRQENITNARNSSYTGAEHSNEQEILTIIQQQHMQNKTNTNSNNVTNASLEVEPPRPHPHAGARFANGSWGLVADVYAPRRAMIERYKRDVRINKENSSMFSYLPLESGEELHDSCNATQLSHPSFGSEAWSLLTDHVKVSEKHSTLPENRNGPKILCAVYSYDKQRSRIQGIVETWGWRCDGFFAASTKTIEDPNEEGFGAIDLPHLYPESYEEMMQKTRSILAYIYDNYLNDFDFFYLSGDDTHMIVENLHLFLANANATGDGETWYLGSRTRGKYFDFASGGGGYVLNRAALQKFFRKKFYICGADSHNSAEDRVMGRCLYLSSVHMNDSVDEQNRQTFFHGSAQEHANFDPNSKGAHRYLRKQYLWFEKWYGFKSGIDAISNSSISFHRVRGKKAMKKHHAALYNHKCLV